MTSDRFLLSVRLLAECYHAFSRVSGSYIRALDLTPSQFHILVTLGATPGLNFKELGEKTLITKGTLTGVIDRLEAKGLVKRALKMEDRRSTTVQLTDKGMLEYQRVFLPHLQFCKQSFLGYSDNDFASLEEELEKLRLRLIQTSGTKKNK
ncbi:MAG: MarR family transcriptional regulator [Noviherbaspirillum sp.]|nr:MarR family transcriptional regulator [Noviherbaspirillum sp.]